MKKILFLLTTLLSWHSTAFAANLLEVYQQAQFSDPIFQEAIAQSLVTKEGVPISVASILPNIALTVSPSVGRIGFSGSDFDPVINDSGAYLNPRNLTQRGNTLNLTLNQTIFNFAQFSVIAQQVSLSKGATATLNAALQNLMTRVANAYFTILKDEDTLSYAETSKVAYAEQLDQIQQQYKVGLKTLTDVYTAQSSYDAAVATYIADETALANDKENLRVITGIYYAHLDPLSDKFPLLTPQPKNAAEWVKRAVLQNWTIKAAQYNVAAAREAIREQEAGHLPNLTLQSVFSKQITDDINHYVSFNDRNGPGTTSNRSVALNLTVPIFSGGAVVANTRKATYQYQAAQQQLEQIVRTTISTARQSYLNIVAGISQIAADKETIQSTIRSLEGLEASYRVGTGTLVDVLNQQQKVFEAQTQYATDRYDFVNNIFALKQAAGTLSVNDLRAINAWLGPKAKKKIRKNRIRVRKQ